MVKYKDYLHVHLSLIFTIDSVPLHAHSQVIRSIRQVGVACVDHSYRQEADHTITIHCV